MFALKKNFLYIKIAWVCPNDQNSFNKKIVFETTPSCVIILPDKNAMKEMQLKPRSQFHI